MQPFEPGAATPFENASMVLERPDGSVVNYFELPGVADRYASGRPQSHDRVLEVLRQAIPEVLPVDRALDVGCGTGHSTVALLPYARRVVGVEPSSPMLGLAPRHAAIEYRKGYAEALPVRGNEFDLVSVASAYHWFDHERFLAEAQRVLKLQGWLVLYKVGSTGKAVDHPEFDRWKKSVLNERYPKVARHGERLTPERAAAFGLTEKVCGVITHRRQYSLDAYVENLMTHSSVIRVIDGGREPAHLARAWLRQELAPFFPAGVTQFLHESWIHLLQKQKDGAAVGGSG